MIMLRSQNIDLTKATYIFQWYFIELKIFSKMYIYPN